MLCLLHGAGEQLFFKNSFRRVRIIDFDKAHLTTLEPDKYYGGFSNFCILLNVHT